MDSDRIRHQQYAQILRLLFKFNLVPRSSEEEAAFIKELVLILKI